MVERLSSPMLSAIEIDVDAGGAKVSVAEDVEPALTKMEAPPAAAKVPSPFVPAIGEADPMSIVTFPKIVNFPGV